MLCYLHVFSTNLYFTLRACINDVPKIKIGKSKIINQSLIYTASHINEKYSNETVGSCLRRQYVKPLVALEKFKGIPQYSPTILLLYC